MKNMIIRTDYPVPSCNIYQIVRESGKWFFEYEVIINSAYGIGEGPLYVWGHIQQLTLVSKVKKGHINIVINNIDDMMNLIKKQADADRKCREEWIAEHPEYFDNVVTLTVKNETQKIKASNIVSVLKESEDETTFIIIP